MGESEGGPSEPEGRGEEGETGSGTNLLARPCVPRINISVAGTVSILALVPILSLQPASPSVEVTNAEGEQGRGAGERAGFHLHMAGGHRREGRGLVIHPT